MPNSASLSGIRCSELDIVMRSHSRMDFVPLDLSGIGYESKSKLINALYSIGLAPIDK